MKSPAAIIEQRPCSNGKLMGYICLNSPGTLNALSLPMIKALTKSLQQWRQDPEVSFIWLEGSGDRAFCAGGDILQLYQSMCEHGQGPNPYAEQFFTQEYRLDYLIHRYPKPIICWGHGVVMGGGLGLMTGASHRLVTEQSRMAMPEVTIGLFPDVGATWFLNRMGQGIGLFLGLTGATCNATDALEIGWADFFLPSSQKPALLEALMRLPWTSGETNHTRVTQLLRSWQEQHQAQLPPGQIAEHRDLIHQVTQGRSLQEVAESILALPSRDHWFSKSQEGLAAACPMSLHILWRQIRDGGTLSLTAVFQQELILAIQSTRAGDFQEGIRALLVDKDRQPKWRFGAISAVPESAIASMFASPWEKHPLQDLTAH